MRLPVWTLALCVAAAVVFGSPPLQALLIYNREAISEGEIWRLVTGNLVHLSTLHFVQDVLALLATALLIETARYRHFAPLCLVAAALIGAVLYVVEPGLLVYGGLSGVVTAALTYFCLHALQEGRPYRWLWLAGLLCLTAKIAIEVALGFSLSPGVASHPFVPVPTSHAVGAAVALVLFALAIGRRSARRPGRLLRPGVSGYSPRHASGQLR